MKRIAILLTVLATALVMAVPAGAKKPPKPDDPPTTPEYYTVDIAADGIGIATTCSESLVLRRNGIHFEWYSDGDDPQDDDPNLSEDMELYLSAPGLMWPDHDLTGCQDAGAIVTTHPDGSEQIVVGPGYFRVTLEEDGTVAMLWIFDAYERADEVRRGNKIRTVTSGRTDFRMGGPYDEEDDFAKADSVTIEGETITIVIASRPFHFVHYDSDADPMFVELSKTPQTFSLTITLTPVE